MSSCISSLSPIGPAVVRLLRLSVLGFVQSTQSLARTTCHDRHWHDNHFYIHFFFTSGTRNFYIHFLHTIQLLHPTSKWYSSEKTAFRSDMRFLRYKTLKSVKGPGRAGPGRAGPGREYSNFSLKYERTRSARCARSLITCIVTDEWLITGCPSSWRQIHIGIRR